MPIRLVASCAYLLVLLAAPPLALVAQARGPVYDRITPAEFQGIMHRLGYALKPYKRSDDIKELIGSVEGLNYSVLFYRCDNAAQPHCGVYQYWAKFSGLPVTAQTMDAWNRKTWLSVAYRGDDGAVRLTLTQRVEGGVAEGNFAAVAKDWRQALAEFVDFIGFKKKQ